MKLLSLKTFHKIVGMDVQISQMTYQRTVTLRQQGGLDIVWAWVQGDMQVRSFRYRTIGELHWI